MAQVGLLEREVAMSQPPELPNAMERVTDERLREALAEVKRALIERIGPDFRLILFGSRARGDAELVAEAADAND